MLIRISKMAATAGHRLTLDYMGKCTNMNIMKYGVNVNETTTPKSNCIINAFFSETLSQTQSKLHRNVHWIVLYKVRLFVLIWNPRWWLRQDLVLHWTLWGKCFKTQIWLDLMGKSCKTLLYWNHLDNWNQTFQECSFDGPLQIEVFLCWLVIQASHHLKS
jgi:hypothetical protein